MPSDLTMATDASEPLRVSILRQGAYLIASIHTALDDGQLLRFQRDLIDQIGAVPGPQGVIIDVAALDVLDSFASPHAARHRQDGRLRGAETVIVGIEPERRVRMVRLGLHLDPCPPRSTSRRGWPTCGR